MAKDETTFKEKIKDFLFAYRILLNNKRKDTIAYTVCTVLSQIASILFDVFFISIILDLLINGAEWETVLATCISGALLVLLRVVLSKIAAHLSTRIYTINKARMNTEIYKKSLDYSFKEYCNPEFYDSYKLVIDSGVHKLSGSLDIMTQLIGSLILCIVFAFEFFRHNVCLVLIIAAALAIHFLIWKVILEKQSEIHYDNSKRLKPYERTCEYYERQFYLRDSALDLKNKTLFGYISGKYIGSLSDLKKAEKSARKRSFGIELLNPIVSNSFQSLIELTIIFVIFSMGIKEVSVYWELIALFGKMTSLYLFRCVGDLTTLSKYVRSYKEFFSRPARAKNKKELSGEAPMLEIHDLCFSYKSGDPFRLKNINICILPGKSVAIVGRNGSGKTTLMNLLLGAYTPDSGYISVKTASGKEIELSDCPSSMLMQEFNTYYTTIRNNITMGSDEYTDEEILKAAHKAKCDFPDSDEHPLDASIGKEIYPDAIELSGGQSQRIALARCFLSHCPLILLDEPTAKIDPIFEKPIIEHLLDTMSKKTSVIITHRLDITEYVDRIYVMEDGEIIESGTFKDLMSKKSVFRDMYKSQKGIQIYRF